jgi:hypothetical protein
MDSGHLYALGYSWISNVSQGTSRHVYNGNLHMGTWHMRHTEKLRMGIKKGCGRGCHRKPLYEAACTVSDIKCCFHVWVTDW